MIIDNVVAAGINGASLLTYNSIAYSYCEEQPALDPNSFQNIFGNILAYITIPCYMAFRPGQIYKNFKRKSC